MVDAFWPVWQWEVQDPRLLACIVITGQFAMLQRAITISQSAMKVVELTMLLQY